MAVIQPLGSGNSQSANINQTNDAFRQLNREQVIKTFKQTNGSVGLAQGILPNNQGYGDLLYDSSGNARIMLRIKNDVPELKISKTGYDVLTAPDNQLLLNSNQNNLKIIASGDVTVTRSGGSTIGSATVSYASYGFAQSLSPGLLAFSSGIPLPIFTIDTSGASAGFVSTMISCSVNYFLQQITFTITAPDYAANSTRAFSQNAIIHYYLTQETAN